MRGDRLNVKRLAPHSMLCCSAQHRHSPRRRLQVSGPSSCWALLFVVVLTCIDTIYSQPYIKMAGEALKISCIPWVEGLLCCATNKGVARGLASYADLTADYAPPRYFGQHPLVQGFQLRDKFIGLDMDKAKDVLVRAYQYESDTHGLVVKDGLNIHIQVHSLSQIALGGEVILVNSQSANASSTECAFCLQPTGFTVDETASVRMQNGVAATLMHIVMAVGIREC